MDSFHTISAFLFLFRCSLFCWHHHPPLHLYSRSKGFIPVTHFTGIKAFPWRRSTYSHLLPPLQCPLTLWTNREVLNLQITVTQPMVLALDYLWSEFWIFFSILVSRSQVKSEYMYYIIMWTIDPLHPGNRDIIAMIIVTWNSQWSPAFLTLRQHNVKQRRWDARAPSPAQELDRAAQHGERITFQSLWGHAWTGLVTNTIIL